MAMAAARSAARTGLMASRTRLMASRTGLTASARSASLDLPECPHGRSFSSGRLFAKEGMAKEAVFFKKLEDEKLKNLKKRSAQEGSSHTIQYPLNMAELMDIVEGNDYDYLEIKYALRILLKKAGPQKLVMLMEISNEDKGMENADRYQVAYVRDLSKAAIVQGELLKSLKDNQGLRDKCKRLEQQVLAKKPSKWKRLKNLITGHIIGHILEVITNGGGFGPGLRRSLS